MTITERMKRLQECLIDFKTHKDSPAHQVYVKALLQEIKEHKEELEKTL